MWDILHICDQHELILIFEHIFLNGIWTNNIMTRSALSSECLHQLIHPGPVSSSVQLTLCHTPTIDTGNPLVLTATQSALDQRVQSKLLVREHRGKFWGQPFLRHWNQRLLSPSRRCWNYSVYSLQWERGTILCIMSSFTSQVEVAGLSYLKLLGQFKLMTVVGKKLV